MEKKVFRGALKIMIACGGTGGHLYPGVSIAEEISSINSSVSVVFACTGTALEKDVLSKTGFKTVQVGSSPMKGISFFKRIAALAKIPVSIIQSIAVIKKERPNLLIGVGGYAAGPLTLAAWALRIPLALVEPNAIAGFTNRMLARFARRIYTGFAESGTFFPPKKVLFSGNPVRREIMNIKKTPQDHLNAVFCFGGSQGALALNRAVISALPHLTGANIKFFHQVGLKEDIEAVRKAYAREGFEAEVFAFTNQIWDFYAKADLVISRAGAATIAELAAAGLPSILIPYPYAADDHQRANALSLVRRDAAVMIEEKELTGARLAEEIMKMDSVRLKSMSRQAANAAKPDAAKTIAMDCMKLVNENDA